MPAPARGAATLHDVAREAGVSLATASRVLNGSTRKVAESYRERVEAAAAVLGYTANLSAQATARGTSAIVALIVADIADPSFSQLAAGVARGAEEAGLIVTVAVTDRDPEREVRIVRALRGQRPRGLILGASRTDSTQGTEGTDAAGLQSELDALSATGCRVVAVGRRSGEGRSVGPDEHGGGEALATELARLGYREAVVVTGDEGVRSFDRRLAGFTEGFMRGEGNVRRIRRDGLTRDAGYAGGRALLDEGLAAGSVIVGIRDVVAIGAMSAVRDAGREVGADVAVAGFDDIALARDAAPGLTTVRIPLEELGRRAVQAVLDEDPDAAPTPLPVEVIVRGSTPARA